MNLSDKIEALAHKDDRNDGAKDYDCTPCGKHLQGRWHHCPTCHLTFPQEQGFVRHREGDYHPGPRTCRTAGALAADGWKYDDEGDVWRLPDPKKKGETDAAVCRCGAVWLMPWQPTFLAEGAEHGRTRCRPEAS